jgi:hypothetical protein
MDNVYEDFDTRPYDPEFCDYCSYHFVGVDWDEGGPDVVGGVPPRRVIVHICNYRNVASLEKCPIVAYERLQERS